MNLEKTQEISLEKVENDKVVENKQTKFLETSIGKIVNTSLDIGLKIILPDFMENEVISLKDKILENGLKDGISKAIKAAIDVGRKISNISTENFESISEVKETIEKGGLIDKISKKLEEVIDVIEEKGTLTKKNAKKIKEEKNNILDTISEKLKTTFSKQLESSKKLDKYISNWNKYYEEENLDKMCKEFEKIKKENKNIIPFEKSNNEIEKIENIHNLINSKNGEFNLSEIEKELIKKFNQ